MRPQRIPIGLQLGLASRVVNRAFDAALEEAGGTLPVWLILLNLRIRRPDNQRELADAVGVREATLTHHLNAMDARGLITRRRDTDNRRIHVVELTDEGLALFERLQEAAVAFDARLRQGLDDSDIDTIGTLLSHLASNAGGFDENALPWAQPHHEPLGLRLRWQQPTWRQRLDGPAEPCRSTHGGPAQPIADGGVFFTGG
jgi:MarR family transcriptional regulator, transcriptional regulator for hemolysin